MKSRDVVVIGGGLAGAAAAARLAQNGADVLLLEKEPEASHKICGEFISYEAQHYLEELGVKLSAIGAIPVDRLRLIHKRKTTEAPLGFEALSLSRRVLDDKVLAQAQSQGAEIRRGVNVTGLTKTIDGWRIHYHEADPIIAKAVFHATGKHDLRNWSRREGRKNDYISFKMYFRLNPTQHAQLARHVEIVFFQGGYAGLEPVEDGIANLCLVVTKRQFAVWHKSWPTLLDKLMETPHLADRLKDAMPCWNKPLSIFGIPYGFVYSPSANDEAGLFRLGDQMAVIPSLCGDGMAIALHTGFLATDCYMKSNSLDYHRIARRQLEGQIRYATIMAQLLSIPLATHFALILGSAFPGLISNSIARTRIRTS